jgi:hypothetical protein
VSDRLRPGPLPGGTLVAIYQDGRLLTTVVTLEDGSVPAFTISGPAVCDPGRWEYVVVTDQGAHDGIRSP